MSVPDRRSAEGRGGVDRPRHGTADTAIQATGLSAGFGGREVLQDVSLTLKAGESADYVLGSTRRGYLVPAVGDIEVNGVRTSELVPDLDAVRSRLATVES